jgi:prolyl-tRNA synthetase
MKLDKLVGERFKDRPADCVIDSHALMVRGGYIKNVGNGIYSSFHVLKRITRKIEQIIREEMDAIDGQEVSFPVAMPASLWEESGRYYNVKSEMVRFKDRNSSPMVLGMTHEEPAVQLVREYGQTYAKYPFMVYQIQTKFRDEARPRAGLIRTREFTMKDAYSFHTSVEDFEAYYKICYEAYERIFKRAGLPETIAVLSDSGMMGGKVSHEFMFLTPVGEDTIVTCGSCDFRANTEAAESIVINEPAEDKPLELVHTPGMQTIEAVCDFLDAPTVLSCKAVIYQKASDKAYVVVFLRGDLEVNETKVKNIIDDEILPAVITDDCGLKAGYIGPYGLSGMTVLIDRSLEAARNICCGANKEEYHYIGLDFARDMPSTEYHDLAKAVEGGICPACKKPALVISRGIEVGNIFQLGTKYTKPMNMQYTDQNGELHYPIMGCYGIGVGRLAATVCEAHHDDYGPIWPLSIAPWQVHICCVRADDAPLKAFADDLYAALQKDGIEVIYDDRSVSAGVMFSDADLLGVPVRAIVSPRNMKEGVCEIVTRDKKISQKVKTDEVLSAVKALLNELRA